MSKAIEPSLKFVGDYLKLTNDCFVIPEYQRAYSWSIEQCDKLWRNVEEFADSGSDDKDPYFFGTIIADCSRTDVNHKIGLIDGQQRTTTFLLLLKALFLRIHEILATTKLTESNEVFVESLKESRNSIADILFKTDVKSRVPLLKDLSLAASRPLVIENYSMKELYKDDFQKIISAKGFVDAESTCFHIPWKRKDNKYSNFFRNFKFFYEKLREYRETNTELFARTLLERCQVIEIRSWDMGQAITMFNSLNSDGQPLTDTDIFSAKLYSKAGDDRSTFQHEWEEVIKVADRLESKKIAKENAGLDSLFQQNMYIERAKAGAYEATTPGVRRFYTEIKPELLDKPIEMCRQIGKLAGIWDVVKDKPSVKVLLRFNENSKLFLASFLSRFAPDAMPDESIDTIAECLLKLFAILELVDAGYSSANFKSFLFKENVNMVNDHIPLNLIRKDFKNHISKNWTQDNIMSWLLEYDKSALVFLNEYLYAKEKGLDFDFDTEHVNIEHIMPNSGHDIKIIQEDAGVSPEEFDGLVDCLGNKILLEEEINKAIGRSWFKTKKTHSVKEKKTGGYRGSDFGLAKALAEYPKDVWEKEDIKVARGKAAWRICNFIFSE